MAAFNNVTKTINAMATLRSLKTKTNTLDVISVGNEFVTLPGLINLDSSLTSSKPRESTYLKTYLHRYLSWFLECY